MTRVLTPDICILGAGSGGLSVAAAAAAFGVEVVLVERDRMGGDCLNAGCVPSKALLAAARQAQARRSGVGFGVGETEPLVDFAAVGAHVRSVIAAIAPHDSVERFEALGVTVLKAEARFGGPDRVMAGDCEIRARRFVVATGSRPLVPPIPGLDAVPYLTNETLFDLTECPAHLLVLGGGPIGMEMAQAHRRLGAQVTVVEAHKALGRDDPELAAFVLDQLRAEGVEILEGSRVEAVEQADEGVALLVAGPGGSHRRVEGSHLLVAAGRAPVLTGLGLDAAGIGYGPRGITVDGGLRTTNRRVYAIGDVIGGLQFTHAAGYHAGLVVRSILFRLPAKENRDLVPWVTYTAPELAQVGLSEAEARRRFGDRVRVLAVDYAASDRARADRATIGRLKLIAGQRGRLLGAGIAGALAGEMANLLSLALAQKLDMKALAGFVAPYPTYGELVRRAALSYYAGMPANTWVRRTIRFLRLFG
ncbi:dihydrolipoyl dehydrogenase family protein [Polymorphum gilvum]|uniref:Pyridine nucleotide-disulfide oxidoreductase dimerization protein n=1 Tax=Polymorphum gilvum (strain LMG 25793 / CGMCC 1.9160 / SL003B-26A1) TaxID=991905 RepID=F2J1Z0_POLGS|nr:FAD-dependent oxidoreductase [Polymorphum gilvum]ADZ72051.1 Pyridine nucleotide-disulfide oxidoreductase dimerization protein [Polymorphum gilvum SL003B-26A1]